MSSTMWKKTHYVLKEVPARQSTPVRPKFSKSEERLERGAIVYLNGGMEAVIVRQCSTPSVSGGIQYEIYVPSVGENYKADRREFSVMPKQSVYNSNCNLPEELGSPTASSGLAAMFEGMDDNERVVNSTLAVLDRQLRFAPQKPSAENAMRLPNHHIKHIYGESNRYAEDNDGALTNRDFREIVGEMWGNDPLQNALTEINTVMNTSPKPSSAALCKLGQRSLSNPIVKPKDQTHSEASPERASLKHTTSKSERYKTPDNRMKNKKMVKAKTDVTQICRHYFTAQGCKRGSKCRFYHPPDVYDQKLHMRVCTPVDERPITLNRPRKAKTVPQNSRKNRVRRRYRAKSQELERDAKTSMFKRQAAWLQLRMGT